MTSAARRSSCSSIRSDGPIGRRTNFDPPPATYCSSRLAHDLGGAERGARGQRRLVDAAARDEGRGERARPRGIVVEPEVQQRAEVVARHLAPRLGREGARLLDARAERLGRDERRDPAVAEAARAPHRGLAVAADPDGQGLLHGPGEHRDALEFPEFAVEGDLALTPAAAHDLDRLVGPAAALLEGHGCRLELTLLLDADADRRQDAAAREVVEHRELARGEDGRAKGRDQDARSELEPPRARRHRGHGRHGLEYRERRGEAVGEPDRVDLGPLAQVHQLPDEVGALGPGGPRARHDADPEFDLHGEKRLRARAAPGRRQRRPRSATSPDPTTI